MLRSNWLAAELALLVALTACQRQTVEQRELSQADKTAVKAEIERYRQAVLAGDWSAWGSTLMPDVFFSPPHMAPVTSRDAAIAWAKGLPRITSFTVNVEDVGGRGDLAYARGSYAFTVTPPNGAPTTERGIFLELHRRQADGTWPYTHAVFHSTDPLPAAPAAPSVAAK